MRIIYYEEDDILFIKFNDEPITREVSQGWNVNISYTGQGIGEITLLEAKAAGFWPIVIDSPTAAQIANAT
ncbi:DUF2283 domain-containing protein [Candidatus Contendibacter odensensis]|uniref:DUF2283 domain-containing protein n=1 Tax=Candidatus Contendobacter odensis Run_B_J11 TaxID=1400861 RepID=A0A7U7GDV5_9GAMM|nr:DUF2283 domain-containing protein [Candidatus Contendobacter odensis]CDH46586.1 conserved hypothetical protein [Candidatus Contendobacter odensis Run_B_J11]